MTLNLDDPWAVHEPALDLDSLGAAESVFSLSNGYVGMRGSLEEAAPRHAPGTFCAGVYETHPLAYPEQGYGDPDEGEAIIGVADGSALHLMVDGAPFDVTEAAPECHSRVLDLRTGMLRREVVWCTLAGTRVRLRTSRLVSLTECSVSAIRYEFTAIDGQARVHLRTGLAVNETPTEIENDDPRVEEALDAPFEALLPGRVRGDGGVLVHRTRRSRISVGAAVAHVIGTRVAEDDGDPSTPMAAPAGPADPADLVVTTEADTDRVTTSVAVDLQAGEQLLVIKHLGHAWSRDAGPEALGERAVAAVDEGVTLGWDGLRQRQADFLDSYWAETDVEVEGDAELQLALRYCLFQLLSSAACIHDAPIGAKGLTGSGYSGHTFWDIEGFVLPALSLLRPDDAARLLRWRAGGLDQARQRAEVLGLRGAAFPWRTIGGHEVSAYWPASTAAMHVNADIARAFDHWSNVTGQPLEAVGGLAVLIETARLWISMSNADAEGRWHLFGMTGPDEYTGVVDDNVFTNLMAQRSLHVAADVCERDAGPAAELGVDADEIASWREVSANIYVPWDEHLGVHPANEGFTTYREWRFAERTDQYPVQEHSHYAKIYRRQVIKQADLVQALWWCRDAFTPEELAADLEYYEARTVRDSSLSAAVQAVVCAQADHVDLALAYLKEAAMVDLRDLQDDTKKGLHLASLAGAWFALVSGLGGLREDHDTLELAPHLPARLSRTAYRVRWRGSLLQVETTRSGTTLTLPRPEDAPMDVVIDGAAVRVTHAEAVTVPLRAPRPLRPTPKQPEGREPRG